MGKLTTKALGTDAGIGSYGHASCGDITIHGGNIAADGGPWYGAGIGGGSGSNASCGDITIHGGIIHASGEAFAAGIGSGSDATCGNITITGGTIAATAGRHAAGIGGGWGGTCGNIVVSGGIVTATGGEGAAGIGNADTVGSNGSAICGNISITGGVVTATAGKNAATIGNSRHGTCGSVSLGEGMAAYELRDNMLFWELESLSQLAEVPCVRVQERIPDFDCPSYIDFENGKAVHKLIPADAAEITKAGEYAGGWYILSGVTDLGGQLIFKGDAHIILKDGANVKAQGINLQNGAPLAVYAQSTQKGTMGKLTIANVPSGFAGIGGGPSTESNCGDIVINGGEFDITSGYECAGIGGGRKGGCGSITINGGIVDAAAGDYGAGIGGGYSSGCGSITINGGTVDATAGDYGAGIGGGYSGPMNGSITINGGKVRAYGEWAAPGIGSGYYSGKCPGVTINGGEVYAEGGTNAPGIGASVFSDCGTVTFNGGVTEAMGGWADTAGAKSCGSVGNGRSWVGTSAAPGKCDGIKLGTGVVAYELTELGLPIIHILGGTTWLNEVQHAVIGELSHLNPGSDPVPGGDSGGEMPQTGDSGLPFIAPVALAALAVACALFARRRANARR